MTKVNNPYLQAHRVYMTQIKEIKWELTKALMNVEKVSSVLKLRVAWSTPSPEAIAVITSLKKPILELGAGLGYWAWVLAQAGIMVEAYDKLPPQNIWIEGDPWYPVKVGTQKIVKDPKWKNYALMLGWPLTGSRMPEYCLDHFTGSTFIYYGPVRSVSARPTFFNRLDKECRQVAEVQLPQWPGPNEKLLVYER